MNPLNILIVVVAVVAGCNAGLLAVNPASGSVGVSADGVVISGPSGSVRTDNGLGGWGSGAQLSGPGGDVRARAGAVALDGSGIGIACPAVIAAPSVARVGLVAPAISSRTILAAPAISSPTILGAPGLASTIIAAPDARLGLGLNTLTINGLGLQAW